MRAYPILMTMLVAVMFLLPPAVADETVTYEYTAGPSVKVGGIGLGIYPCPDGCDVNGDGQDDYPFDHGPWTMPLGYHNVLITADDVLYGPNVGLFGCWFHPEGDDICGEDDLAGGPTCGTLALISSPFGGGTVQVYVIALLVQDDLTTCGATKGTITLTAF